VVAAEETARELLAIRQGVPQPAVLFVSGYQGAWGVGWDGKRAGAAGGLFFGLVLGWPAPLRSGTPFVMITLGLSELVSASAYVFIGFFGAEKGVTDDPGRGRRNTDARIGPCAHRSRWTCCYQVATRASRTRTIQEDNRLVGIALV
jgi:ABC-type branched-subunit amino acid transport system permease subunit